MPRNLYYAIPQVPKISYGRSGMIATARMSEPRRNPCLRNALCAWSIIGILFIDTCLADEPAIYQAEVLKVFDIPAAQQGVAVDEKYFYALNKRHITKHDKVTGRQVSEWPAPDVRNLLIHMDSLVALDGKLYAAHSNYPTSPMTSSVEVWDAQTMDHIGSYSFGIDRGSLTWLDRHDGFWWGGFANYDKVQEGQRLPYGLTDNTQVVKFDDQFEALESWTLPRKILDRMRPMSNSGGSWGPDGFLYLTGHDRGEIYVMSLPEMGSVLDWVATVKVPVLYGQGIAWDRSTPEPDLWGIRKDERKVVHVKMPKISRHSTH